MSRYMKSLIVPRLQTSARAEKKGETYSFQNERILKKHHRHKQSFLFADHRYIAFDCLVKTANLYLTTDITANLHSNYVDCTNWLSAR